MPKDKHKMTDVNKKVLLELVSAPVSLLPAAVGICMLLAAWAFSSSFFGFLGVCGILAGMAMFVIRLIFQLNKLTEKAQQWQLSHDSKNREIKLDELYNKLCYDLDPRTETALRDLRSLQINFKKHIRDGTIKGQIGSIISENVDALFDGCVVQLRRSFEMFKAARNLKGEPRATLREQRDVIVADVVESIDELSRTITKCYEMATNRTTSLAEKRKELQATMEAVAQAEQEVENIVNGKEYDESEFLEEE